MSQNKEKRQLCERAAVRPDRVVVAGAQTSVEEVIATCLNISSASATAPADGMALAPGQDDISGAEHAIGGLPALIGC
tara:strand:- start:3158 stop:3391 length:234 start_codon:yes stop_codon:yes gene_type:complete